MSSSPIPPRVSPVSVATLTVDPYPVITTQPESLEIVAVMRTSPPRPGISPLDYQWYLNGALLGGDTNSTLALISVQPADTGSYTIVVTNPGGSTTSHVATLTVYLPPAITNQPQSLMVAADKTRPSVCWPAAPGRWVINGI